jgi:regulator of protease activity HflC (stomatin/prohibitin superfamily)
MVKEKEEPKKEETYQERSDREFAEKIRLAVVSVAGVFVFLVALSSLVTINTGTVGVMLQFGEMKDVLMPGLHFVIPFITSVQSMSVQTMKYEVQASAASSDLQIVTSTIAVNYHIKDDRASVMYLFQQFRGDHESRIIAPFVQEAVKANTAKFSANDLIERREVVKLAIANALTEKLATYGITVDEVSITNFDFSPEFNQAIEAKVVVEQQKQQSQIELEQKMIEVQKLVVEQNATATAQIIQATADMETAKLIAEGNANATLTNAYASKQAIEMIQAVLSPEYVSYQYSQRWDGKLPYLMSGGNSGFLFNVPVAEEPAVDADWNTYVNETG